MTTAPDIRQDPLSLNQATAPRASMSSVWDRTAEFLGDNLGAVATVAALTLFVPAALDAVLKLVALNAGTGTKLAVSVLSLIFSVVALFGQLSVTALALDPAAGPRGAFRTAASRLPLLIGISVLLLVALLVVMLPLIALLVADGVDMAALETGASLPPPSGATLAVITAYLLIGLPLLLWVSVRLSVATPVIVAERRGLGSLARAFRLTRGSAARIFGVLLLLLVVGGVAVLAVNLVVGTVARLTIGSETGFDPAAAVTVVIVALASTALTVVLSAFLAKLYLALVVRQPAGGYHGADDGIAAA